ncbi:MAG: Na+/H+ antiporter subunit E [Chloroflexota bacterium]|nr:Na+/H+ antiporter subunit E [Chloroflexota bacterium]
MSLPASRWLLSIACLTLVYAFVLVSFHPWDLLVGALLSAAVLWTFRAFLFGGDAARARGGLLRRMLAFVPFCLAVARDVAIDGLHVALIVLHLHPLEHPGIVAIPIGERTPTGIAVSSLVTGLTPGSFLVDVDYDRGVMLFHMLDATDPDSIRARLQRFYERYQRHVFP